MRRLLMACLWSAASAAVSAQDDGIEFSVSGFLTVAAGKVLGGDAPTSFNGYKAPIYVSDYGQGGVYERKGWTLNPDSKLGLQGSVTFSPGFSFTGQVVSRAAERGRLDLEWAYLNYVIDDHFTLQLGRKRLPLFYYSETQDVGLTYPWVHLPSGQYGWEVVNYDGANLLYQSQWGTWSANANLFSGGESRRDNPYQKIYHGRNTRTDTRWSSIVGADLSLARSWFEVRTAYVQSMIQNRFEDPAGLPPYSYSPKARQKIYSLSFAVDHSDWVVRNEYLYMDRKQMGEEDYSFLLGVGYRIGRYLPMVTHNRYRMRLSPGEADPAVANPAAIDPLAAEGWSTLSLSLRIDLTPTSSLKGQLDRWKDRNGSHFNTNAGGSVPYGDARLFTFSYDMVF